MADLNARFADVIAKNPTFKGATGLMAMNYEGSFVYGEQDRVAGCSPRSASSCRTTWPPSPVTSSG